MPVPAVEEVLDSAPPPLPGMNNGTGSGPRPKQLPVKPLAPAPPSPDGKTLVLCFDGTANEYDDTNTNVVKLFGFLEKEHPKQRVYYQVSILHCYPDRFLIKFAL